MFDVEKATNSCIEWVRTWFEENGADCNAVIGISGGKDSTIAAALCCKALGADRVIGVLMPNGIQADIADARRVVETLGIKSYEVNIAKSVCAVREALYMSGIEMSNQANENLTPRVRMSTLYAVSQSNNGRVCNTCNFSEEYVGYSTRWGDSVGDFSPLGDYTVTEVLQIGDYLGLPNDLVHKVPSDGLCGKSDEDNLGFTYAVLDRYIRTGEIQDANIKQLIDIRHKKNLFKLKEIPKCPVYWAA